MPYLRRVSHVPPQIPKMAIRGSYTRQLYAKVWPRHNSLTLLTSIKGIVLTNNLFMLTRHAENSLTYQWSYLIYFENTGVRGGGGGGVGGGLSPLAPGEIVHYVRKSCVRRAMSADIPLYWLHIILLNHHNKKKLWLCVGWF